MKDILLLNDQISECNKDIELYIFLPYVLKRYNKNKGSTSKNNFVEMPAKVVEGGQRSATPVIKENVSFFVEIREAAKKSSCLNGRAIKALPPRPRTPRA